MPKRLLNSRKAISPILATLLLIVIAVAAIVVTYAWIMTYMTSATTQAGVLLKKDAINWQNGPPKSIIIYVRNTGTSDATIDAIYIGTSSTNLALVPVANITYNPASKVALKEGGTVTITLTYTWTAQTAYWFRIAPAMGEAVVFQEQAP